MGIVETFGKLSQLKPREPHTVSSTTRDPRTVSSTSPQGLTRVLSAFMLIRWGWVWYGGVGL